MKVTKKMINKIKRLGDANLTYFFFGCVKTICIANPKDHELQRRYNIARKTAKVVLDMEKKGVEKEDAKYQKLLTKLEKEIDALKKYLYGRKLLKQVKK